MTNAPTGGGAQTDRPLRADPDLTLPDHEVLSETGREREQTGLPATATDVDAATGAGSTGVTDRASAAASEAAGGAKDVASTAAQQGAEVVGTATEQAKEVAGVATDEAKALVQDAAHQARSLVSDAQQELRSQLQSQTERLVGSLQDVSSQLRSMADGNGAQPGLVSDLVRDAAERTNQLATHVRDGGFEVVVEDARRFARNRPGVFLLGALGAGFAIGRIVRSVDTSAIVDAAKSAATGDESQQASQQQVLGAGSAQLSGSSTVAGGVPELGA